MAKFRFQDFEIWQMAIELADKLFDIADELDTKRGFIVLLNSFEGQGCQFQTI
jgi:hypothetical protein